MEKRYEQTDPPQVPMSKREIGTINATHEVT